MIELDNNQKAKLADYINGLPVDVSDEELQMLSDDDKLAAECIDIAEISAQAAATASPSATGQKPARKTAGKTIRMVMMAAAACLLIAIAIPLIINSDSDAAEQPAPRKRTTGILSAKSLDKGYYELPQEFSRLIQSASAKGYYDFAPETPFDIVFTEPVKPDTLYLCSPRVKTPLMTIPVSGESATISQGLASGLYYYYLKYNLKERNAISIGTDNE